MPLATNPATRKDAFLNRRILGAPALDHPVEFIETLVDPLALIASLWLLAFVIEGDITMPYVILSIFVFSMTYPSPSYLNGPKRRIPIGAILGWVEVGGLLYFMGYASHLLRIYDPRVALHWLWLAPLCVMLLHLLVHVAAPRLLTLFGPPRKAVIVGMSDQGLALGQEIRHNRVSGTNLVGYFDDRPAERLGPLANTVFPLQGKFLELPDYARKTGLHTIYIALPITGQPRLQTLLDELRDTTASIYFVPDVFTTDLIQGRMSNLGDIPLVAVCESPFTGAHGTIKRLSDIVLSLLILVLISPLLLLIAFAVKLTSPGPILFRQRRYGLDGEEITVYKFRSMTVCEDGAEIRQAQRNDQRVTPLGAILRRTSLDELPQFINVLQGRMSIVGPRPHAVAHNEMYRKLIKGYMIRHKVKPGITGWAQVNGLRGETDTLEKMKARVDHDLDYLRNWSLHLDIYIILKTILVVFRQPHAY